MVESPIGLPPTADMQAAIALFGSGPILLQNSFWTTEDKFSKLWTRRSNNRAGGTTATSDELIGNFGSALEDTSIGDCRLVALFAEKKRQAIFGVLQHNRGKSGLLARG
jgi:hypothetical protein